VVDELWRATAVGDGTGQNEIVIESAGDRPAAAELVGSGSQLGLEPGDLSPETVCVAASLLILRPLELIDQLAELQFQPEGVVLDSWVRHTPNPLLWLSHRKAPSSSNIRSRYRGPEQRLLAV
jgi:hypothetical protein